MDPSNSSRAPSRRENSYGQQRSVHSPPSRPQTAGSRHSGHSLGHTTSYQQPAQWHDLTEDAAPPPAHAPRSDSLEQAVSREEDERRDDIRHHRRGTQSSSQRQQSLTEVLAPPPVERNSEGQDLEEAHGEDDSEDGANAPPAFRSRRPEAYVRDDKPRQTPAWLTQLYAVSYLIFFAFLGTLARLGVQWLTFYPGVPIVTPVIWANFGGSAIMGFLSEDQKLFRDDSGPDEKHSSAQSSESDLQKIKAQQKAEHAKRKKTIPLYIGLATGFCGSFTSFSSFARDFFLALANELPAPIYHPNDLLGTPSVTSTISRPKGYSFEAWSAVVLYTLALSIGGLIVGAHIAIFLDPYTPRIHVAPVRRFLDPAAVVLGWLGWLGAVFLAIWPPDRPGGPSSRGSWANETWRGEVIFALVFAPVGCLLRYYASMKLNGLVPSFPLGTFAVNMLGTAIEAMCYDIQHVGVGVMGRIGGGRVGCQILQGVQDGFCGCLTTVSTWVAEINGLNRRHSYTYALSSVMGALGLMVAIMGSVYWSVGFGSPTCNTGYTSKVFG